MCRIVFYLLSLILITTACKKEPLFVPDGSISETPIFVVSGTIGSQNILMQAGVDDVTLTNENMQINRVNHFGLVLTKNDDFMQFLFSDGAIDLQKTIQTYKREVYYSKVNALTYTYNLNSLPNALKIGSITTKFEGVESNNSLSIDGSGIFPITHQVRFANGEMREINNKLMLGYEDHGKFQLLFSTNPNSACIARIIGNVNPISSIKWYVDNSYFSSSETIQLPQGNGSVVLKTEVIFENGIVRNREVIVDTDGNGYYFGDVTQYKTELPENFKSDFSFDCALMLQKELYTTTISSEQQCKLLLQNLELYKVLNNGNKVFKLTGRIVGDAVNVSTGESVPINLNVTLALEIPM